MSKPLVSIIIPVYNAERYLTQSIDSAVNQTWANKEIIIVDDGSTDSSLTIARRYQCDWIKVLHQKNKGASAARNKALEIARGEYIQFLDADDVLSVDKIELQMAALADSTDYIVFGHTIHFKDGAKPHAIGSFADENESIDPLYFLQRLYGGELIESGREGMIQPNAWLTSRVLIDKAGYWNEELTLDDDGEFFCRAVLMSKMVLYTPNAINYYRKYFDEANLSSQKNYVAYKSALLANELKFQHLKKISADKKTDIALAKLYTEYVVSVYPQYIDLYKAAMKRLQQLPSINYIPVLGGKKIEFIKKMLGWRAAKYLIYVFNRGRYSI